MLCGIMAAIHASLQMRGRPVKEGLREGGRDTDACGLNCPARRSAFSSTVAMSACTGASCIRGYISDSVCRVEHDCASRLQSEMPDGSGALRQAGTVMGGSDDMQAHLDASLER